MREPITKLGKAFNAVQLNPCCGDARRQLGLCVPDQVSGCVSTYGNLQKCSGPRSPRQMHNAHRHSMAAAFAKAYSGAEPARSRHRRLKRVMECSCSRGIVCQDGMAAACPRYLNLSAEPARSRHRSGSTLKKMTMLVPAIMLQGHRLPRSKRKYRCISRKEGRQRSGTVNRRLYCLERIPKTVIKEAF